MIDLNAEWDLGFLKDFPRNLHPLLRQSVVTAGQETLQLLQDNAPRMTGALAAGFYLVTRHEHGGEQAATLAQALRPGVVQLGLIPPVVSDYHAKIGITQPYWVYVEYGRNAQPFIEAAVQAGMERYQALVSSAFDKALEDAGWRKV